MQLWKVLGVAGLAGVAATGVAVARSERRRRDVEPDEVRARLRERYDEVVRGDTAGPQAAAVVPPGAGPGCLAAPWARLRGRRARRRPRPG